MGNTAVKFVQVHGLDTGLDLVVSAFQFLDAFCTGSLLGPIGVEDSGAEPLEDGRRDNQVLKNIGAPAGQGRGALHHRQHGGHDAHDLSGLGYGLHAAGR